MEMVTIILTVPVAFVLTAIYSIILDQLALRLPELKASIVLISIAVLVGFSLEIILLISFGIVKTREIVGASFYPVHALFFVAVTPALASLFVLRLKGKCNQYLGLFICSSICSLVALMLVLLQYNVAETLGL